MTEITQIQQTGKGSSNRTPDTSLGHAAPRLASTKPLRHEGDTDGVQTPDHLRRGDEILSAIKDLLDANREALVADASTTVVLESLLPHMDQNSSERLVLALSSLQIRDPIFRPLMNSTMAAGLSPHMSARAMFVRRLNAFTLIDETT